MDKPTYQGRGPSIPDTVTSLIAKVYDEDRDRTAKEVMVEVHRRLREEGRQLRPGWPGLSAVQKVLTNIRKKEPNLKDRPWSLDALRDYPLPPEALPLLFRIWLLKQEDPFSPPLSIREAGWIAQLSTMTGDIELLRIVAEMCAEWELIGELTDIPQLSSPVMVLHIYSLLTRMAEKELKEHHQEILKGKQVSGTRRTQTMAGLEAFYGKGFIQATKLKAKGGQP